MSLFSLSGKIALITGASRGLGQAMAEGLAAAGADIAGLNRSPSPETRDKIESLGQRYFELTADLLDTTPAETHEFVQAVVSQLGGLDILLNNAGTIRRAPVLEFAEQDWQDVLAINLSAVFFLSQAAARHMVQHGGGKIINMASMLSFQGGILVPSYTAAKSGIAGLTKAMANELAAHRVNVNAIAPGYMASDMTAALQADPERNKAILERIPAGRWGEPTDLQGAAVFLASAASDYMHGAIIPVDGGWLCR